jgi:type VI secretion system protein ImpG
MESRALGAQAWRLVDHLSLNYLSINGGHRGGADTDALKSMLLLYCDESDRAGLRQIDGLSTLTSAPITARLPTRGPVAFGRGVGIELTCEEGAFEGGSPFLLGAVLDRFFARYVSINSFTQLTLRSTTRATLMKWPVRAGCRELM